LRTLSGFIVLAAAAPASGAPELMLIFGTGMFCLFDFNSIEFLTGLHENFRSGTTGNNGFHGFLYRNVNPTNGRGR